MNYSLSKQQKLDYKFRIGVAKKFGIEPISLRASRFLDKYCASIDEAIEWAKGNAILKQRNIGKKSVMEIRIAFGLAPKGYWRFGQQALKIEGLDK